MARADGSSPRLPSSCSPPERQADGGWHDPRRSLWIRYIGRSLEALGRDGSLVWKQTFDADVSIPRRGPASLKLTRPVPIA